MIMHQSWDPEEIEISEALYGCRPIQHLADIGVLDENLTLVHMNHLDRAEVELVAESGARVVHCPAASLRRGMGAIREGAFPEMLGLGIPVALGSDGYSGRRDVLRQAYLAAVGFREFRGELPVLTGETVLDMATRHGARALGLEEEVGSIEVGKRADLVVHTLNRPEAYPRFQDPVDSLVYFRGSSTVDTVFVEGGGDPGSGPLHPVRRRGGLRDDRRRCGRVRSRGGRLHLLGVATGRLKRSSPAPAAPLLGTVRQWKSPSTRMTPPS